MSDLVNEAIRDLFNRKGKPVKVIDESDPSLSSEDRDTLMAARRLRKAVPVGTGYASRSDLDATKEI